MPDHDELVRLAAEALEPHWRTDCSDSPADGSYVRWVRCRCGWESPKSRTKVNMPDMHRIWNGHVASVLLAAKEATEAQVEAAIRQRVETAALLAYQQGYEDRGAERDYNPRGATKKGIVP